MCLVIFVLSYTNIFVYITLDTKKEWVKNGQILSAWRIRLNTLWPGYQDGNFCRYAGNHLHWFSATLHCYINELSAGQSKIRNRRPASISQKLGLSEKWEIRFRKIREAFKLYPDIKTANNWAREGISNTFWEKMLDFRKAHPIQIPGILCGRHW